MGTILQRVGARGVLASLWPVVDAGAAKSIQTLYLLHSEQPELTKAAA